MAAYAASSTIRNLNEEVLFKRIYSANYNLKVPPIPVSKVGQTTAATLNLYHYDSVPTQLAVNVGILQGAAVAFVANWNFFADKAFGVSSTQFLQ